MDIRQKLNTMERYRVKKGLEVNLNKTMIVKFKRTGQLGKKRAIMVGGRRREIVEVTTSFMSILEFMDL